MPPCPATTVRVLTPPGEGGIGVIELAGHDAVAVLDACFAGSRRAAAGIPHGALAHGRIVRGDTVLDEVIVARRRASGVAFEVNCHGGAAAVEAVVRRLAELGAERPDDAAATDACERPLAGDAIRARALAALPRAATRLAARMLLHQAAGALDAELNAVGEELARRDADAARARIERLVASAALGLALLAPPRVALAGPPNAGKSTLLNALLKRERVIVNDRPGTTRDVVRDRLAVRGIPFEISDSAGVHDAPDAVERAAVQRAAELVADCDVAVLLYDVRADPRARLAPLLDAVRDARVILVGNKTDLVETAPTPPDLPFAHVFLSARRGEGIDRLEAALMAPYESGRASCAEGAAVVFDGHALDALRQVRDALDARGAEAARAELARSAGHAV